MGSSPVSICWGEGRQQARRVQQGAARVRRAPSSEKWRCWVATPKGDKKGPHMLKGGLRKAGEPRG